MAKTLKLYNGRGDKQGEHLYVGAYSRADAARMLDKLYNRGVNYWQREIKEYFSDCWGNAMLGIEPRRGVWVDEKKYERDSIVKHIFDGLNNKPIEEENTLSPLKQVERTR